MLANQNNHIERCKKLGLYPDKTSQHALECKKFGLDSNHTSANDLKKAGSKLYN